MRVISWNCRGLDNASTVHHSKKIVQEWKPDFCFLLETRLKEGDGQKTLSKWGYDFVFEVPRRGLSGGLALGWSQPWTVNITHSNSHFIHTEVKDQYGGLYSITFIYEHPQLNQRKLVWQELESLATQTHQKWLCIRDFNQIPLRKTNSPSNTPPFLAILTSLIPCPTLHFCLLSQKGCHTPG